MQNSSIIYVWLVLNTSLKALSQLIIKCVRNHLLRTKNVQKNQHFLPPDTHIYVNFAYLANEWYSLCAKYLPWIFFIGFFKKLITFNRPLPIFFFSNFAILFAFKKICKWFGHLPTQKINLQNFKQFFPSNFTNFWPQISRSNNSWSWFYYVSPCFHEIRLPRKRKKKRNPKKTSQPEILCSKLTIETLEQGVKYV